MRGSHSARGGRAVTIQEESRLTHLLSGAPLCRTDKTPDRGPLVLAVPHIWSHSLDGSSQNHCKSQEIKYPSELRKDSEVTSNEGFRWSSGRLIFQSLVARKQPSVVCKEGPLRRTDLEKT